MSHEAKRRKTTAELIKDLRLFNHLASAERMEHLDAEVRSLKEALATAAAEKAELERKLRCYGHDGLPVFADRSVPDDGGPAAPR